MWAVCMTSAISVGMSVILADSNGFDGSNKAVPGVSDSAAWVDAGVGKEQYCRAVYRLNRRESSSDEVVRVTDRHRDPLTLVRGQL